MNKVYRVFVEKREQFAVEAKEVLHNLKTQLKIDALKDLKVVNRYDVQGVNEEALKEGLITEDQMQEAMDAVAELEQNYHRLTYVMYLLDMPKRKSKQDIYVRQYKNILDELCRLGADIDSIKETNSDALIHFKAVLKKLKNETGE